MPVSAMKPDGEEGSLQEMLWDLETSLERTLDQQQRVQRELFAEFLQKIDNTGSARQPHAGSAFYTVDSPSAMRSHAPPMAARFPGSSIQGDSSPTRNPPSFRSSKSQLMFQQVRENSMENDIEWLDHAVVQPAVRTKRAEVANGPMSGCAKKEHTDKKGQAAHADQCVLDGHVDGCLMNMWTVDGCLMNMSPLARTATKWYWWWMAAEEPRREGCLHDFIESTKFNIMCVLVICLNAVVITYTTDLNFAAASTGQTLKNSTQNNFFEAVEYAFLAFYMVELALKLMAHRLYFFVNEESGWNILDFTLVCTSLLDAGLHVVLSGGGNANVSFIRVLRLLRVSKVFRIFRALKFVSELRLMLDCLLGCFLHLFWAIVLILFLISLFSICFVQGATTYLETHINSITESEHADLTNSFGSVVSAMSSLFQAASGGRDWYEYYEMLVPVGGLYSAAFIFYVLFMMISVFNIVTSIFVDRAMKLAKPTERAIMAEKEKENLEDERWLFKLCEDLKIDQNGDGYIDYDDVKRCMADVSVREHFNARGISFEDTHSFYQMLIMASEFKGIDIQGFVTGCIRLKGQATNMDLHTLVFEVKLMHRAYRTLEHYCKEKFTALEKGLKTSGRDANDGTLESSLMCVEDKMERSFDSLEVRDGRVLQDKRVPGSPEKLREWAFAAAWDPEVGKWRSPSPGFQSAKLTV